MGWALSLKMGKWIHGFDSIDRRQHRRWLFINPPVTVEREGTVSDLMFDLGEGGLSVYGLLRRKRDDILPIRFDLPGGAGSISCMVRIAWTSCSRNRTGMVFEGLTDASRQLLRQFMSVKGNKLMAPVTSQS